MQLVVLILIVQWDLFYVCLGDIKFTFSLSAVVNKSNIVKILIVSQGTAHNIPSLCATYTATIGEIINLIRPSYLLFKA